MKKIILTVCLLETALLPQAGTLAKEIETRVERAVAEQQAASSWKKELKAIQKLYEQNPSRTQSGLPVVPNTVLRRQYEAAYNQRIEQLQQSINGNKTLQGFALVTPIPEDLATLSLENYAALHAFLKGLRWAQVTHTQRVRPFTLSLQIQSQEGGNLELWIDVPTRNVYLMSDNINTTAQEKYGMLLR